MPEVSADSNVISPYLTDESSAFCGEAERIYFPLSGDEVAQILAAATGSHEMITVSGGGTSITGARVPYGGSILATDRILELEVKPDPSHRQDEGWKRFKAGDGHLYVDQEHQIARVPAGIRLSDLDAVLEPLGLFYPPTLTEMSAMAGGTIATNASGARSFRYGSTRKWVEQLKVALTTGEVVTLRRGVEKATGRKLALSPRLPGIELPAVPSPVGVKNAAGFHLHPDMDAIDLFIGGEGTLGVIVEADLRLAPRAKNAVTLLVFAQNRDRGLDFADAARTGRFEPWQALAIEYFDRNSLNFMRDAHPDIPDSDACILVELAHPETDHTWHEDSSSLEAWSELTRLADAETVWVVLPTEAERVRLFRHALPDKVNDYVRTRTGKLGTDLAVPGSAFRDLVAAYDRASVQGVKTVLFGHLGEYHLHMNFLADDSGQMERARQVYLDLAKSAVALGGTVSAEHGVGKKRVHTGAGTSIPYLELMYDRAQMAQLAALKLQLDPSWILNPGTVLPVRDAE